MVDEEALQRVLPKWKRMTSKSSSDNEFSFHFCASSPGEQVTIQAACIAIWLSKDLLKKVHGIEA